MVGWVISLILERPGEMQQPWVEYRTGRKSLESILRRGLGRRSGVEEANGEEEYLKRQRRRVNGAVVKPAANARVRWRKVSVPFISRVTLPSQLAETVTTLVAFACSENYLGGASRDAVCQLLIPAARSRATGEPPHSTFTA